MILYLNILVGGDIVELKPYKFPDLFNDARVQKKRQQTIRQIKAPPKMARLKSRRATVQVMICNLYCIPSTMSQASHHKTAES